MDITVCLLAKLNENKYLKYHFFLWQYQQGFFFFVTQLDPWLKLKNTLIDWSKVLCILRKAGNLSTTQWCMGVQ